MKLKSEMLSSILKILLWALVILTSTDLIATIIYLVDIDFYLDAIYSVNSFLSSITTILYYIILVVYLIWIYRVHMDLNEVFFDYPRTPGGSLACSMIPFYSFYGLPSIYLMIGKHFQRETTGIEKQGKWISRLAIPLVICFVGIVVLNRIASIDDLGSSSTLLLSSAIINLIIYIIFLMICIFVAKGLQHISLHNENSKTATQAAYQAEWEAVNLK